MSGQLVLLSDLAAQPRLRRAEFGETPELQVLPPSQDQVADMLPASVVMLFVSACLSLSDLWSSRVSKSSIIIEPSSPETYQKNRSVVSRC